MRINIAKTQPQPSSSPTPIKKRILNTSIAMSTLKNSGLVMHSTIKTATPAKIKTMSPLVNFAPFASCAVGTCAVSLSRGLVSDCGSDCGVETGTLSSLLISRSIRRITNPTKAQIIPGRRCWIMAIASPVRITTTPTNPIQCFLIIVFIINGFNN